MQSGQERSGGLGLPATNGAQTRPPESAAETGPAVPDRPRRAPSRKYDYPGREREGVARRPVVQGMAAGENRSAAFTLPIGSHVVESGGGAGPCNAAAVGAVISGPAVPAAKQARGPEGPEVARRRGV